MPDYDAMRLAELAAISEYLHELDEPQWDETSLCEGWRVRDVVSHMCVGYTTPMPRMFAKIAKRRFNVPKASYEESIAFGTEHTPAGILSVFDEIHRNNIRKGIAKVIKPNEGLVDHLIHHQDIRRPLGQPRQMPSDRLVAALDVVPGLGGFVGARTRVAGLRLVATDVDWSHGDGPEVHGSSESMMLMLAGRPIDADELSGPGAAALRTR